MTGALWALGFMLATSGPTDGSPLPVAIAEDGPRGGPGAEPIVPSGESLRLSAEFVGGGVWGKLAVGEGSTPGTDLNLRHDLGLRWLYGPRLRLSDDTGAVLWTLETEYLFGSGREVPDQAFLYNGHVYAAGVGTHLSTNFFTARGLVTFKDPLDSRGSWIGPVVGLEYPYYLTFLSSHTRGSSSEDWTHYVSYPVAGLAGHVFLDERLSVGWRVTAGYWPNLATPYTEGGRLYASVRPSIFATAPVEWNVSSQVTVKASVEYRYWRGWDHSPEDANVLKLSVPGFSLGLDYRW